MEHRRRVLEGLGTVMTAVIAGCSSSRDDGTASDHSADDGTTATTTLTLSLPTEQTGKLSADDGDTYDRFGHSVAVSNDGSTAVFGATEDEDPNGDYGGSAYVFSKADGSWSQEAKLAAEDGDTDDRFGWSVAVSGDGSTAIVGARDDEEPNGESAGSAYVFSKASGSWSQAAKLAAEDGDSDDRFGGSVALSNDGSTVVVGAADDEDPNGLFVGSAYVFSKASGSWSQEAKLAAGDGDDGDAFGHAVAVSGDGSTAIVCARDDEDPNGDRAGSAYVFSGASGSWTRAAKLAAEDGDSDDRFGGSVALSNDGSTAVVGAAEDEDPNGNYGGSAYVFSRASGSWSQEAKLAAADGDRDDLFGLVAVSGDGSTAVVGARDEDPNGDRAGSAYVFAGVNGSWSQAAKLVAEDGDPDDLFGDAVAVTGDGSSAIICAPWDEDPNGNLAGSAYVFE